MGFVRGVVGGLTGSTAAKASLEGARIQQQSIGEAIPLLQQGTEQAQGFLQPFQQLGEQGLDQASFLTDPQAQFDFLQNNPLFQSALASANTQTQNQAASRGRLSAGDTLQQLSQNVLLSASPLIGEQKRSIQDLLGLGTGVAGAQANTAIGGSQGIADLVTSGGAVGAGGVVGAGNARSQGSANILNSALLAGAAFSDERLKDNIQYTGTSNGFNIYSWTWNKLAESLGLIGDSFGVLAQEVEKIAPESVTVRNGYRQVNYGMIGVSHGG